LQADGKTERVGYGTTSAVAVQSARSRCAGAYPGAKRRERQEWQWRIPLQHRIGNGLVYSSAMRPMRPRQDVALHNLDGKALTEPRFLRFQTGRRHRQWHKNCVALGLSSGFLEPLESTSIHLMQNSLIRFIKLFPSSSDYRAETDQFNRETKEEIDTFVISSSFTIT
jgi:tryptophan halogenase